MSLDVYLTAVRETTVYDANITHNCGKMARQAGIYQHLWRPGEIGIERAGELIAPLTAGVGLMRAEPDHFREVEAANGWGTYDQFLPWVEEYLLACIRNPDASVSVSV